MVSPATSPAEPGQASAAKVTAMAQGRSGTPRSASAQTPTKLDDDTIEDVIQRATAAAGAGPPPGKDTRTQLFVGNLPYRVRWQDLKDLFRKAGTVLRADVSLGPDNRSRGYGTVLLASAEDAGKATDMYNGYVWQNRTLEVRLDRLPPEMDMGLNHATASLLPNANPMIPLVAPQPGHALDPLTRPMSASLSASDAAPSPGFFAPSPFGQNPNGWVSSGGQSTLNRQLFIGNLPFQCQWQDLKDLFRSAGPILRADVALGPDGRSRGFGTVVYAKESDAARAVGLFNGYDFHGRILKVHHDRYSPTNQSGSLSPNSLHATTNGPLGMLLPPPPLQTDMLGGSAGMHLVLPRTPEYAVFPSHSQPASPYDQYPPGMPSMMSFDSLGTSSPPPDVNTNLGSPGYYPSSPQMPQPQLGANHPGPISLPPAGVGQFPPASALSPLMTRAGGLPPMTPSMPGFNFNPQTAATPPLHAHFLSPGLGPFSPQLHSPPFLSAGQSNPYLNPAPGAPPRLPGAPAAGLFGTGPGAFGMHHAPPSGLHNPYFPAPEPSYFSGLPEASQEALEVGNGESNGPDSGDTVTTSFEEIEDGLALQLREVKIEGEVAVPSLSEAPAPKRPGMGPSRSSLPESNNKSDTSETVDLSSSADATPEAEHKSALGLGLDNATGGIGDRRASWNATSRPRIGASVPPF